MNTRTTPLEEFSYIGICLVEVIRIMGLNVYEKIRPVKND